jgi:hypothetical protein
MSGTLTINIAAPGTAEISGGKISQSLPGHVWYTVTDNTGKTYSFGFDPVKQGSPFGIGQVVNDDSTVYQGRFFSQSASLTDAQVQALVTYGESTENIALANAGGIAGPIDASVSGFNSTYNVLGGALGIQGLTGNNCISYVNGALSYAKINSGQLMTALTLPEMDAGSAANILNALEKINGGDTISTTEQCGNNDEYSCTLTGHYSAPDANGNRTLLSDTWTGSDGSKGTDVYNSTNNFTSTTVNKDGSSSFVSDVNGTITDNFFSSAGLLQIKSSYNSAGQEIGYELFSANGNESEYAGFSANGAMTQDLFFDANTGRETQENDFNADGSQVDHIFNANGTQNAAVFNAAGHETEYATFGTNGAKTQDLFYDATSGRLTQENDFNADGSQIDHLFNANGTQTAYVFNAAGHETEQATFGANGAKTQDLFYDATTGRETQENDFNADGSQVDHLFNANGTQTAYVFNAAGHETEQATFGTNGKITQDLVYDGATGRELQETDYNTDGSGVAHIFNPDGTQNAAVFDPSGHVSEYATYGTNGKIATDAFYDANGRETQLNEYSGNQTTVHVFNSDN